MWKDHEKNVGASYRSGDNSHYRHGSPEFQLILDREWNYWPRVSGLESRDSEQSVTSQLPGPRPSPYTRPLALLPPCISSIV